MDKTKINTFLVVNIKKHLIKKKHNGMYTKYMKLIIYIKNYYKVVNGNDVR